MSIFNRLFGSKKVIDKPAENQQKQPGKPELENPETKINQNLEANPINPPIIPELEIKKEHKETDAKVTDSNPEMPQSSIPWRTFSSQQIRIIEVYCLSKFNYSCPCCKQEKDVILVVNRKMQKLI
jgi:hypothetical protein